MRSAGAEGRQEGAPWFAQVPEHKAFAAALQPAAFQTAALPPQAAHPARNLLALL